MSSSAPARRGVPATLGGAIWVGAASTLVLAALLWAAGLPAPGPAVLGGALASALAVVASMRGEGVPWRRALAWAAAPTALALACCLFAGLFYDVSYDGPYYHQIGVMRLAGGWNPLRGAPIVDDAAQAWVNHYAKGPWIVEAGIYALGGRLEAAKGLSLLLMLASGLLAFAALRCLGLTPRLATAGAALLAANPVSLYQSLNFYVDGQLASGLLAVLALLVLVRRGADRLAELALAASALYLVNVKFTGVLFLGLVGVLGLAAFLPLGGRRLARLAVVLGVGALLGVLGPGYNPYVTNTLRQGHPLYPLFGAGKTDIMSFQTDREFARAGAAEKLVRGHFSRGGNDIAAGPRLKVPFAVSARELAAYRGADVRFAGFGPWFGGLLLLALGLAVALGRRPGTRAGLVAILGLALSAALAPEAWWARYAPHLWIPPILVALWAASTEAPRLRRAGLLALGVAGLNCLMVLAPYGGYQLLQTWKLRGQLRALAAEAGGRPVVVEPGAFASVVVRLEEAGLSARRGALGCPAPRQLAAFPEARLCLPEPEQAGR